jgi:hypothetical protein
MLVMELSPAVSVPHQAGKFSMNFQVQIAYSNQHFYLLSYFDSKRENYLIKIFVTEEGTFCNAWKL